MEWPCCTLHTRGSAVGFKTSLTRTTASKKVSKEEKTQQKVGPLPSPVFSDSLYLVLLAYGAAEDGNWLDHAGKNQARK